MQTQHDKYGNFENSDTNKFENLVRCAYLVHKRLKAFSARGSKEIQSAQDLKWSNGLIFSPYRPCKHDITDMAILKLAIFFFANLIFAI